MISIALNPTTSFMQDAIDAADAPALRRLAAFVAAEHAAARDAAAADVGADPAAAGPDAAGSAAAHGGIFAGLPRRPLRTLPAAVLDAGGAPAADTARAIDALAALLAAGDQVWQWL